MEVVSTDPRRTLVRGALYRALPVQNGDRPCLVLEMIAGEGTAPVEIHLDWVDLSKILRCARESNDERIRDAVRLPLFSD
jgi:hypothetical protein